MARILARGTSDIHAIRKVYGTTSRSFARERRRDVSEAASRKHTRLRYAPYIDIWKGNFELAVID